MPVSQPEGFKPLLVRRTASRARAKKSAFASPASSHMGGPKLMHVNSGTGKHLATGEDPVHVVDVDRDQFQTPDVSCTNGRNRS